MNIIYQQSYLFIRRLFDLVLIGLKLCLARLGVKGALDVELIDDVPKNV
jgi:hypothetical protein